MSKLRGVLIGCGYFAKFHLHGWNEVQGARIVAVCDRQPDRAESFAREFRIDQVYHDAARMLDEVKPDFVDVVTTAETHRPLVELAAAHGTNVICQKPLAPTLDDGKAMVAACGRAGVRFMVHENFRWQRAMRGMRQCAAEIGELFFGRISMRSGWNVYESQPYLATDPRFIIYDLGIHLLDLARFYFGEFDQLTCLTQRVNPKIRGEDVATILLHARSGATCIVDCSYGTKPVVETFPQTFVHLEGTAGTATLGPDFLVRARLADGPTELDLAPATHTWSRPPGLVVQDSILRIQQHWVDCFQKGVPVETSGEDNLRTLQLVFAAYDSAASGQTQHLVPIKTDVAAT